MSKKWVAGLVLCLMLLVLLGVAALAFSPSKNIVLSADGRYMIALKPPSQLTPLRNGEDAKLTTIAGNLSKYEFAPFFCCYGNTIAQGPPAFPFTTWVAIAFTPAADSTITKVEVPVGTYNTNDIDFLVTINSDDNGVPGDALHTFHMQAPNFYGYCCSLDVGKHNAGIPVSGGKQYWIAVKTSNKNDFFGGWPFNTTDMRAHTIGSYCKGDPTYCGNVNNGKWVALQQLLPAYAVLGH